jgi:hypothetical protein
MFGKAFLIRPVGIFLLDTTTVSQHDLAQIVRCVRAVNLALESLLTEPGEIARVINVGMGQKDAINLRRGYWKRIPVSEAILFKPLKQTAIDQEPIFPGFHNKA